MTAFDELEPAARKAAVAAAGFVAAGEDHLATHVLTFYLMDAEAAGHTRTVAMSALVGQLLSIVAGHLPPELLAQMALSLGAT